MRQNADNSENGAAVVEYLSMLFTFSVILIALLLLIFGRWGHQLIDKPILITCVVVVSGGISWAGKSALSAMYRRIQFLILEYLSDNQFHDRQEILAALRKRVFVSIYLDALAELVLDGKVVIENGKYKLPQKYDLR